MYLLRPYTLTGFLGSGSSQSRDDYSSASYELRPMKEAAHDPPIRTTNPSNKIEKLSISNSVSELQKLRLNLGLILKLKLKTLKLKEKINCK